MRIPPYWARGNYAERKSFWGVKEYSGLGWSFTNIEEAQERAVENARRIATRLSNGEVLDRYEYGERPVCEEIVRRIEHDGDELAIISRNRYGSLVLNAANVMFVDVDIATDPHPSTGETIPPGDAILFPPPKPKGFWKSLAFILFRTTGIEQFDSERFQRVEREKLLLIKAWFSANPDSSGRIYRTALGFRVIVTSASYEPASAATKAVFESMRSDPLYQKLTVRQESFRARLTPKPWRLEIGKPPVCVWPREHEKDDKKFQNWLKTYEEQSGGYDVCHLQETVGDTTMSPKIAAVVAAHDAMTLSPNQRLPLA